MDTIMNKRSLLVSLGVSAGLVLGAVGLAAPALAAPGATAAACSGNLTCTYVNAGYDTFLGSRAPGSGLQDISAGNRNRLSSWINYTSTGARFYYNTGGGGTCVSMGANNRASASASNPDNDQAESWAFTRTC
jgi:hypothetical protein